MNTKQPFTFDRVVRIIITLVCAGAAIWIISYLSSVLLPFMVAWLLSYLMEPFVQYNRRLLKLKGRFLAVFLTLLESCMVVFLLCFLFVPSIISEMHQMSVLIKEYSTDGVDVPFLPKEVHTMLKEMVDLEALATFFKAQGIENTLRIVGDVLSGGLDVLLTVFNWILVLLYMIFIMLDYERLLRSFKSMVPPRYRKVTFKIVNDVKDSMNHYFRGQALIAFCVGILFAIGFSIIHLPLAIVLGLFIGLLNMVPYLQLVSIIPTTFLCLVYSVDANVDFWIIWWESMGVYLIVQAIQDLILTPKIMGHQMGLNPAIILLSLSIWGALLGFIGLIIALPLTTLILAYYNQYILTRDDGETPHGHREDQRAFIDAITFNDYDIGNDIGDVDDADKDSGK